MSVVFYPDQQLTKNDLNIFVRNSENVMFDPAHIVFSVYDSDDNSIFVEESLYLIMLCTIL